MAEVLTFATPKSRAAAAPADEHVGEFHVYKTPGGDYYLMHRTCESFEEERELYRGVQSAAARLGFALTESARGAGADVLEGDNGLVFAFFAHHSGHSRVYLSDEAANMRDPDNRKWLSRQLATCRKMILDMCGDGR